MSIAPALSFSIIVPARHEEEVLAGTLSRLVALNHPAVEILVVVGEKDEGTRATAQSVNGKPHRLRVLTDHSRLKNKPKALDTGLPECRGDIVGVIDAEDEVNPALLHHFEVCFRQRVPRSSGAARNW